MTIPFRWHDATAVWSGICWETSIYDYHQHPLKENELALFSVHTDGHGKVNTTHSWCKTCLQWNRRRCFFDHDRYISQMERKLFNSCFLDGLTTRGGKLVPNQDVHWSRDLSPCGNFCFLIWLQLYTVTGVQNEGILLTVDRQSRAQTGRWSPAKISAESDDWPKVRPSEVP